jgi:hypothetical protein
MPTRVSVRWPILGGAPLVVDPLSRSASLSRVAAVTIPLDHGGATESPAGAAHVPAGLSCLCGSDWSIATTSLGR